MPTPFRFEGYPTNMFDMQEVTDAFTREWRALFPLVLANTPAPDTVMWAEKRNLTVPLEDPKAYTVVAVGRNDVLDHYAQMQRETGSYGTVCVDVPVLENRLRLSHHIFRNENWGDIYRTDFYRGDRPSPVVAGESAPEPVPKPYMAWSADLKPDELTDLSWETPAPNANNWYNSVPVTHEDPARLFDSFCESGPEEEDREIYFTYGPYAATFEQLEKTLAIICHLAGQDTSSPWGN